VPKVSVIVRKAYGAGLYAMSGPAFEPEATIALPTAKIAVMGPEAAVNAVFANKIEAIEDPVERDAFVAYQREIYEADVDLLRLASELVVDAIVDWGELRGEVLRRLARAKGKTRHFSDRRHGVPPV
jgi:acetyl-CoA carboxylase carboxyltransferase component